MDEELLVPAREDMAGLLVRAEPDARHRELALEAATDTVVNTLGLAPCLLDAVVAVGLVALLLAAASQSGRARAAQREEGKREGAEEAREGGRSAFRPRETLAKALGGETRRDARRAWSAS